MLHKIEDFLLNKFAGKIIARGAVTAAGAIAAYLSSDPAQAVLAKGAGMLAAIGFKVEIGAVDQAAIAGAIISGAHWAFEWFKARRMENPASPAVQTDKDKL